MASGFGFPMLSPAEIAEDLVQYGIAPVANLRPEDIAKPQPDLLPTVLSRFLASFVDAPGDGEDGQLGFSYLEALDNPEHHSEAIRVLRLYHKSRAFLESIQFKDLTLADLLRPTPGRVVEVLSALINFLFYREDKLNLLQPIVNETPNYDERTVELKARIAQLQKEITDHELAEQMEEPMAQQLEADVNALQQKVQVYNKQQLALRAKATAINDKKEEIHTKRALEEKKSVRAKLKESEKTAIQNVQEKTATLELLNKAHEKLTKQYSKIQDVQEQLAAAKTVEKEIKARKAKLNDESVSVMSFDAQIVEWQGKVHKMEARLKAKVQERNQIIADENQKLGALRSETECKLQGLEPRERKVEAMIAKATKLCSEAASARTAAIGEQQKICAKFDDILKAFDTYMSSVNPFLERVEEVGRQSTDEGISAAGASAATTKTTPRASATSKKSRARKRT
ncbi:unnamed protein product [Alopecurus aequalis]